MRLIDADALRKNAQHAKDISKWDGELLVVGLGHILSAPTIESPRPDWTPCAEGLPVNESKDVWEEYEVTVCESHYPTCSYGLCDAPYSKEIVTTALFDDEQKIWHICRSKEAINALLKEEDYPLNGDVIIAWRDIPAPYNTDTAKEDNADDHK